MKMWGGYVEFSCGIIVSLEDFKAVYSVLWAIRLGSVKATREERGKAKILTHAMAYSAPNSVQCDIIKKPL